ncbi:hypothetical protein EMCG_06875 [[Emmonsia] crescens]|uniref:Uncharacterized protein n=1 Tax=[Emmonsia] crescens TaxID=73230 RepID=A0A0G2J697_9EURO|nr:hypothetical protein EMCG_06875 [Emmonsia crescens UAMH 3008]
MSYRLPSPVPIPAAVFQLAPRVPGDINLRIPIHLPASNKVDASDRNLRCHIERETGFAPEVTPAISITAALDADPCTGSIYHHHPETKTSGSCTWPWQHRGIYSQFPGRDPQRPEIKLLLYRTLLLQDYQLNKDQITLKTREGDIVNRSKIEQQTIMPTTPPPPKNTCLVQWYPTSKPSATPIGDLNNFVMGTLSAIPKHCRHAPPRRSISMVVQALPELQAVSRIKERVVSAKAGRDSEHNNHNECEDDCPYDVGFKGRG